VRVAIIDDRTSIAQGLVDQLRKSPMVELCERVCAPDDRADGKGSKDAAGVLAEFRIDTVVYSPPLLTQGGTMPDLAEAENAFQLFARAQVTKLILLSNAAIYGPNPQNPGLISEAYSLFRNGRNEIGDQWAELERAASNSLNGTVDMMLIILRVAPVVLPDGKDYFNRLFQSRIAVTLPGHDPSLQLLSAEDLVIAVRCAVEKGVQGIYNVAPDGVVPLRAALSLAGSRRLPIPRTLQRGVRVLLEPHGLSQSITQLNYIRYSWTVSNQKIKRQLGFTPRHSSSQALAGTAMAPSKRRRFSGAANGGFDDFGMDQEYIRKLGRAVFNFLERYYWRVELKGLANLPREGRVVMVGLHRGFMPWDGIIIIHQVLKLTGRCPRFLMHPGLVKFPFLANFMTKIGGVIACQENADRVLERDEILGIFPEGVKGAFKLYRDAYQIGRFGRNDFVKIALRHQAPIVPFVTIGSAEIFPILKRIEWSWWKRRTEWPYLPLTFTPLPLPSKWHTQFLPPIQLAGLYPPEAADDPATVRAISQEVRTGMEQAIENILNRRKSIFYGSVFEQEAG
jgi:1-acyl-sn-glycerol-3-phosphate acyltransferase/nucleoside-diphosphate-sugar epimerase